MRIALANREYLDTAVLYKYMAINSNLFSLLINNELWFSKPSDFNDPYDCNLSYDLSAMTYEYLYNTLRFYDRNRDGNDEAIKNRALYLSNNPLEIEKIGKDVIQEKLDKKGIACFSESCEILLMWSHYANSHKGICLTFNFDNDIDFPRFAYKVEYPDFYPKIKSIGGDQLKHDQQIFANKSKEWEYEKEIRIIRDSKWHDKFRGAIAFNPIVLTEIKFGYKSSEEDIKTVSNLALQKYPHIKLYRSQLKKAEFGIEFIALN